MPEQKMATAQALKGQVKSIKPGQKAAAAAEVAGPPEAVQTISPADASASSSTGLPPAPKTSKPVGPTIKTEKFYQSPELSPDTALDVDVNIEPFHRFRTQEYMYWISVQQVVPNYVAPPETTKVIKMASIRGISPWIKFFTTILGLIVVGINAFWATVLVRWFIGLLA
jgi:hypothetical protein